MADDVTERLDRAKARAVAPGDVLLNRYRIVEWIGSGSSGLVMRAFDTAHARVVAIKIRHTEVDASLKDDQRFLREIQAVGALRNEHVTRLFDFGALPDGTPYMVVENLEGLDLRKVLTNQGKLPRVRAVDYVLQVCDALAEAHVLGIVHRDIKPANLMLTKRPDGSELVKVLDFGCAKAPGMDLTRSGSLVGTPAYMSPEQMSGARTIDARSDIWSVGALLYHLVEGHPPFEAQHFMDLVAQVSSAPTPPMVMAPELAPVIDRCLKKRPRDRYASVRELANALEPLSSRPRVAQAPAPTKRRFQVRDIVLFVSVVVVVCAVTLAILAYRGHG